MKKTDLENQWIIDAVASNPATTLTVDNIVDAVNFALNVEKPLLLGTIRKREVTEARFLIVGFATDMLNLTPRRILELYGGRDRFNIHYYLKTYRDLIAYDKGFRHKANLVLARLEVLCK